MITRVTSFIVARMVDLKENFMKSRIFALLPVAVAFSTVTFAQGPYVLSDPVYASNPWELCQIDLESGVVDVIGPTGPIGAEPVSLVYHSDGYLYAVYDSPPTLVRIDPVTRESTVVGPLAIDSGGFGPDLAVDGDGDMWLLKDRDLYQIDPATASLTLNCSLQEQVTLMGLAFDAGNPYTAQVYPDTPVSLECGLNGVVVNVGPDGFVEWLAVGPVNQLYGLAEFYNSFTFHSWSLLYRLDPSTGEKELVEVDGIEHFRGLAFPPSQEQPLGQAIPLLGPKVIIFFCFALAFSGVLVIRIRRV